MAELNSMRRSALDGFHGGSAAARLTPAPNAARASLRAHPDAVAALSSALGVSLPTKPKASATGAGITAMWLGPDEWFLIGPDGTPRDYSGSLDGTPVFLGCSDVDPHIPKQRVLDSAEVLRGLGGQVTARLYPGIGHTINDDELEHVRAIVAGI